MRKSRFSERRSLKEMLLLELVIERVELDNLKPLEGFDTVGKDRVVRTVVNHDLK
jgi:hypothetical protein